MAKTLKKKTEAEVFALVDYSEMRSEGSGFIPPAGAEVVPMPPTLIASDEKTPHLEEASHLEVIPLPSVRVLSDEEVADAESAASTGTSQLEDAPLVTIPVLLDFSELGSVVEPSRVEDAPFIVEDVPVTGSPTAPAAQPAKKYGRFLSTDLIKVLVPNPKRVGSKAHRRFRLYPDGGTVGEYAAALERTKEAWRVRADLNWDTDYGHLLVTRDGVPV